MVERRGEKHPKAGDLREMLRALPVSDAGFVLHLLECPRCAQIARKALAPKPMRRRRPQSQEGTAGSNEEA